MEDPRYTSILRRVAIALIAIGVIDGLKLGRWFYAAFHESVGASTFNLHLDLRPSLLLLVAGCILLTGMPRAASVIRWLALCVVGAVACACLLTPFDTPIGYLLTELKVEPSEFFEPAMTVLPGLLVMLAIIHQLRREPVVDALKAAGVRMRSPLRPMACGAALVVAIFAAQSFMPGGGDDGRAGDISRAKELALEQLGPNYGYLVKSLQYHWETKGKDGVIFESTGYKSATVVAWNGKEIRTVPVRWDEK